MDFNLTEDQIEVRGVAREFAQQEVAPLAREMDVEGEMPDRLIRGLAETGLLGGPLPVEYGGGGWDSVSLALAYEELGRADSSLRGFMTVHTSLVAQCILNWGTEQQKTDILPKLANADLIGCYCLTEQNAGSDVASIETSAEKSDSGWRLNGEKIWITNGEIADLALVFATRDPELRHRGIVAFVVDTAREGFQRSPMPGRELGHRAADHAQIQFENCMVPDEARLGQVDEGFKVAMSALDHGRLGVAAGALGVAQACLDSSVDFARERRQFGKRIGDFEMIQSSLAQMASEVQAARMLVYWAAWLRDQGEPATQAVSMAKYYATEIAVTAANEAVLIHGGRGYSNQYPVERYLRDIKGLQIYEGTSHIQRIVIARELLGRDKG